MNYEQLIQQKITKLQHYTSGGTDKQSTSIPPLQRKSSQQSSSPDTPQFSDRRQYLNEKQQKHNAIHSLAQNNTILNQEPIGKQSYSITVNWNALSDFLGQNDYGEWDFMHLLDQLQITNTQIEINKLWQFMLVVSFDEQTWMEQQLIDFKRFKKIIGLIFEGVQDPSEEGKKMIEEAIQYRSLAHLNRLLYQNAIPSLEKIIIIIRNSIIANPHPVFTVKPSNPKANNQYESFQNIPIYLNSQFSSQKQKNTKGNDRSEKLYQHAKVVQGKARTAHLVRVQQEVNQSHTLHELLPKTRSSQQVFDRLYNQKKSNKSQMTSTLDDSIDEECTFKPKINEIIKQGNKTIDQIPGVDRMLQRNDKAKRDKEYRENYFDNQQAKLQKTIQGKHPQKFQLSTKEILEQPIMYLDIRVSKHKVGRLAVRNGDDTKVLVDNFARTFALSNDQRDKLVESLTQAFQMVDKQDQIQLD